jgi:hypothetical protein
MALNNTKAAQDAIRKVRALEKQYLGLRAQAGGSLSSQLTFFLCRSRQ